MMEEKEPEIDPASADFPEGEGDDLVAYLDGELEPNASEAIEAKLSADPAVRSEADALKKTWDLLDYLPRPEPSGNFTERTISRIDLPGRSGSTPQQPSGASPAPARQSTAAAPAATAGSARSGPPRGLVVMVWTAMLLGAGLTGWIIREKVAGAMHQMDQRAAERELDARILSERRLLQNLQRYRYVDDFDYLQSLDRPSLFGEEHPVVEEPPK